METKIQYLTIKETSELLGVTPKTLSNWDKSGKLVAQHNPVNGYRFYCFEDVSMFLQERSRIYQVDTPTSPTTNATQLLLFPAILLPTGPSKTIDTRALRLLVRQMSRAFRDSMGGGLLERFEEISKLLYCKLYDERQSRTSASYKPCFYRQPEESIDDTYQRIAALYPRAISLLPDVFTDGHRKLSDDKKAVVQIVEILQNVTLSNIPADVKGTVYEELIRNTFEKSDNQQFFTPRPVVEFMVQFINPQPGQTVCDPACGSGGFLIEASKHINNLRKQAQENLLYNSRRVAWIIRQNLP